MVTSVYTLWFFNCNDFPSTLMWTFVLYYIQIYDSNYRRPLLLGVNKVHTLRKSSWTPTISHINITLKLCMLSSGKYIIVILGNYSFLEVTNDNTPFASLYSEESPANTQDFGRKLSFFYYMFGDNVGNLSVVLHELGKQQWPSINCVTPKSYDITNW